MVHPSNKFPQFLFPLILIAIIIILAILLPTLNQPATNNLKEQYHHGQWESIVQQLGDKPGELTQGEIQLYLVALTNSSKFDELVSNYQRKLSFAEQNNYLAYYINALWQLNSIGENQLQQLQTKYPEQKNLKLISCLITTANCDYAMDKIEDEYKVLYELILARLYSPAIELAQELLTRAPRHAQLYMYLGLAYAGMADYQPALSHLQTATSLDNNDSEITTLLEQINDWQIQQRPVDWNQWPQNFTLEPFKFTD